MKICWSVIEVTMKYMVLNTKSLKENYIFIFGSWSDFINLSQKYKHKINFA